MLRLDRVVVDTGSYASVFKTDDLRQLDLVPNLSDIVRRIKGVGGVESVIEKEIEILSVDDISLAPFKIQMGAMTYAADLDGILGMDFLLGTRAQIDFSALEIRQQP